jgi:uncharacterized phiE125 gp8 family phage protein
MNIPRRTVTVVTPPAAEPLILAEAKNWAKIDVTDDDPLVATLITAATASAEQYLRRALITRTLKLTLDSGISGWINDLPAGTYDLPITAFSESLPRILQLPTPPVQSVTSIVTYDIYNSATTFDPSNYLVDLASGRITLNFGCTWPINLRQVNACEITYVAGYGDTSSSVPMPIKTAMLMHVQAMYDGRIVTDMPASSKQLLNPYRVIDGFR